TPQRVPAAQALFNAIGARLHPVDHAEYDRNLAAVRTHLDEATFTLAWTQGQQMTWEQILAVPEQVKWRQRLPMPQPASPRAFSQARTPPSASYPADLTAREV